MYGKLFDQMYDGTLGTRGPWQALVTFQQLVVVSSKDGVVDMTPEALSRRTTIPLEIIKIGLEALAQPDPESRTPDEEGRRIVLLDKHRSWGWRIVNYAKYRKIRSEDERREYHRAYWHKRKNTTAESTQLNNSTETQHTQQNQPIAVSSKQEAEIVVNPVSGEAPDGGRLGDQGAPAKAKNRDAREIAVRVIEYLNEKGGTHFQPVDANVKLPAARVLYDGATEADLRGVVDLKVEEVVRGEFDRRYLRPATLWNAEKFAQYLGQVNARPVSKPKRDEPLSVYAEVPSGELVQLGEYPVGNPEAVARRAFAEYRGAPWMRGVRNLVTKLNGSQSRFAIAELSGERS